MAIENFTALGGRNVVSLQRVKARISHDVVDALEQLLIGARSGDITGIAFACALPGMRHFTDVAGTFYTNPTFARGAVDFLSDELAALAHGQARDSQSGNN